MKDNSLRSYLLIGGLWASAGKVFTIFFGIILSGFLARIISPENMGLYFLSFNFATFLSLLPRFGIDIAFLRLIPEAVESDMGGNAKSLIIKGFFIISIFSGILIIILNFGLGSKIVNYFSLSPRLISIIGFISVWAILIAFQFVFESIFRGFRDIRLSILFGDVIWRITLFLYLIIIQWYFQKITLKIVLWGVMFAGFVNLILALSYLAKKVKTPLKPTKDHLSYQDIFLHLWPIMVYSILTFIYSNSAVWVVASLFGERDIALFGAAMKLVLLSTLFLSIINSVIPQIIAKFNVLKQKHRLEHILRSSPTLATIPTFIILAIFIFQGSNVLGFTFGEFYKDATTILIILSIGHLISVFLGSCGFALLMSGNQKTIMSISIFSGISGLALGILLGITFGIIGVAWATTITKAINKLLMLFFARSKVGVWTHFSAKHLSQALGVKKILN
ncbi:MAG: oligosaccharide flippase family protein [Candidatus Marinimicrobia bacterium]|nr:oligosaccharide flippase family protein [Candidatus Neomarinimicrobiota bacterium]